MNKVPASEMMTFVFTELPEVRRNIALTMAVNGFEKKGCWMIPDLFEAFYNGCVSWSNSLTSPAEDEETLSVLASELRLLLIAELVE
jgi:hypothetical protein